MNNSNRLIVALSTIITSLALNGVSNAGLSDEHIESAVFQNGEVALTKFDEKFDEFSEQLEEVEEIVGELEEQLIDIEERVGSRAIAQAFDGLSLDFGGYITQSFTGLFGSDNSEASFNATQFELLTRAQVTEKWSLFTTLGWLQEADIDFADPNEPTFRDFVSRRPLIIGWVNYRHSDAFQVQLGRFITPHGIINIEHFPPVLLEIQQPQFLRPFGGQTIFPNFLDGLHLHGKRFVGKDEADTLGYHVYTAHFEGGDPDDFITGARIFYSYADSGATLGFNASHGERRAGPANAPLGNFSITPATSLTSNSYDQVGVDLLYNYGNWLWKTEAFYSWENDGAEDRYAIYTQPARRICDNVLAFYRYDFLEAGQGLGSSQEHVIGLNWLPSPIVRTRFAYFYKQFELANTDAHIFQFNTTVSF